MAHAPSPRSWVGEGGKFEPKMPMQDDEYDYVEGGDQQFGTSDVAFTLCKGGESRRAGEVAGRTPFWVLGRHRLRCARAHIIRVARGHVATKASLPYACLTFVPPTLSLALPPLPLAPSLRLSLRPSLLMFRH